MKKNDNAIKKLLIQIEEKKVQLGNRPRAVWLTNGIFKRNSQNYYNINISDEERCVNLLTILLKEKGFTQQAYDLLNITFIELKWDGFTFEEWLHDLKMRVSILLWQKEKAKLNKLEEKLNILRSVDAKTEDAISDIVKELK